MIEKLLIADDEPGVRSLVKMTLEGDAFEIVEATDGPEAIALAREHRPKAVLLDVMMPTLGGLDVCRALKTDPMTASIVVIMLTAKSQTADREEGLAAGADAYLTKPFSPMALMAQIDELFSDSQDG